MYNDGELALLPALLPPSSKHPIAPGEVLDVCHHPAQRYELQGGQDPFLPNVLLPRDCSRGWTLSNWAGCGAGTRRCVRALLRHHGCFWPPAPSLSVTIGVSVGTW